MDDAELAPQLAPARQAQAVVQALLIGRVGFEVAVEQLAQLPLLGREGRGATEQLLLNQKQAFELGAHGLMFNGFGRYHGPHGLAEPL